MFCFKNSILIFMVCFICSTSFAVQIPLGRQLGNVNGDALIDIVDALLTAQYSIGMNTEGFNPDLADVTVMDRKVAIDDALIIAQYAAGMRVKFPRTILSALRVSGTSIVDDQSNPVNLNGLVLSNTCWGTWVWPISDELEAQGKDPMIRPTSQYDWVLTEADVQLLDRIGVQAVRYEINHELFAADNPERDNNFVVLRRFIEYFGDLGIYTILNMHLPAGRDGATANNSKWAPGDKRMLSIYEDEGFWQDHLEVMSYLASGLKDLNALAGYEPDNEPCLPSDAEGGLENYQAKWNELCREMRLADPHHIIFVPEYNSREANQGEQYYHPEEKIFKIDKGEQGIIWERGLVEVKSEIWGNIAYVFHFYEPYDYVGNGQMLNEKQLEQAKIDSARWIKEKVQWAENVGKAPIICTEYGINGFQTMNRRLDWLDFTHKEFAKYHLSATYYCYKVDIGVYLNYFSNFSIYGEYTNWKNELILTDEGYEFVDSHAAESAERNNFIDPLESYFLDNGEIILFSIMGNEPLLNTLQDFWD